MDEDKYVNSVSEFIDETLKKTETLRIIKNFKTESVIWFRGENCEKYHLVPNLYRTTNAGKPYCSNIVIPKRFSRIEQNIDVSFFRKSTVFFGNKRIENTIWNRYFLKQHYKVKTRLLDWTENALVALFFAVNNDNFKNENGKVYILSPFKLNNYSLSELLPRDKSFYSILTALVK